MTDKEPMLLTVLIETSCLRWYVAGIDLAGKPLPLLRSETGNLNPYLSLPFDDQVSFLRHRLSGVLQRGCDRLWGRQMKPCQIVFVADGPFVQADAELTARVAEHFVEWMTRPPVVFFTAARSFASRAAGAGASSRRFGQRPAHGAGFRLAGTAGRPGSAGRLGTGADERQCGLASFEK